MKKFVFLLILAVAMAGFVSAGAAHPPGGIEIVNVAVLYGYSADNCVVIPDTVLVEVLPVMAELSSFQAVMALYNDGIAMRPHSGLIPIINTGQLGAVSAAGDYYLRC